MAEDEEGFLYPQKQEELCIDCGLCKSVCPTIHKEKIDHKKEDNLPRVFMAINKDETIVNNSASGGVFTAVANVYCEDNFVVFGSQFDDELKVSHSHVHSLEEIGKYRKSKYVQSDIGDSFKKAKEYLKAGKKVLFTGTPCQIAGLRLYLKKEYENLFCVDLICHGVPSQKVFDKYMEFIEIKYKDKVKSYNFREKTVDKVGEWDSKNVKINFEKRKSLIVNPTKDKYLKGYGRGLFLRPSCYKCRYSNPKRISDITMGDFWGVGRFFPEQDVHKGVSLIVINTKKGSNLLQQLNLELNLSEVDYGSFIEQKSKITSNSKLIKSTKFNPKRPQFFDVLNKKRFDKAVDHCIPEVPLMIKRVASRVLPRNVKRLIKKII